MSGYFAEKASYFTEKAMTTSDNKVSKRALTEEIFNQRRELVAEIVRLKNKAGELLISFILASLQDDKEVMDD